MAFVRGFKSQCERRAVEFRRQFGLADDAALPADRLATELGVVVWSVPNVKGLSELSKKILSDPSDMSWLAFTLRMGARHLVVHKPVPTAGRRNSIIMHELAHIILGHQLAETYLLDDGSLVPGHFSQDQEDEADWLAGTLLLPRVALISIRTRGLSDSMACEDHLVTLDMLKWRLRMTGVDYQLKRPA